jgi:hypothetical protein
VLTAVFRTRSRDCPYRPIEIKLAPLQRANLGPALAGQDQQPDDWPKGKAEVTGRAPDQVQLLRVENAITTLFRGWRIDAVARTAIEEAARNSPAEHLAELRKGAVGAYGGATGDNAVEDPMDVGFPDRRQGAALPCLRELFQKAPSPSPITGVWFCIKGNEVRDDFLNGIIAAPGGGFRGLGGSFGGVGQRASARAFASPIAG